MSEQHFATATGLEHRGGSWFLPNGDVLVAEQKLGYLTPPPLDVGR